MQAIGCVWMVHPSSPWHELVGVPHVSEGLGHAIDGIACGRTDGSKMWEVSTQRSSHSQKTVVVCVTEGLDACQVVQWDKRPIYVPNYKLMPLASITDARPCLSKLLLFVSSQGP